MMCNVIMSLYDAAVERRACSLEIGKNWEAGGWKFPTGRLHGPSKRSGVELNTSRSEIWTRKHKKSRKEKVQHDKMHRVTSPSDSRCFSPCIKYPAFKNPSPTHCLLNLSASNPRAPEPTRNRTDPQAASIHIKMVQSHWGWDLCVLCVFLL